MNFLKSLTAVACGLPAMYTASPAVAEMVTSPMALNISAQPLGDALSEFARQSGLQVVFYATVSEGIVAPSVVGKYTADAALKKMLATSGLTYDYVNDHTVAVRPLKLSQSNDRGLSQGSSSAGEESRNLAE